MGLGGGSLLALIGGLLFLRRRNAKDEYDEYSPIDFDDPSLAPGSSGFEDDVRAEPGQRIEPTADPFASPDEDKFATNDFQADPMDDFTANESPAPAAAVAPAAPVAAASSDADGQEDDILQEADVYIVYGLHEQAEVELKKAIEKQPNNLEYRAKLLENYHASDNKESFEQAATEFSKLEGPDKAMLWDKVSNWGRKMLPASPLFAGPGVAAAIQNSAPAPTALPAAEPESPGIGGLGMAAGAAALGGVAITAGKAIADSTKDGVGSIGDKAKDAVSGLTESVPSLDDMTPDLAEAKTDVLDFDEMDLDSLLSADPGDVTASVDMPELDMPDSVELPEVPSLDIPDSLELPDVPSLDKTADTDIGDMDFDFSEFEVDTPEIEAPKAEVPSIAESDVADDLLDMNDFSDLDLDLGESPDDLINDLDKNEFDSTSLNLALDGSDSGVGKILPDNSVYKMSGDVAEKSRDDVLGEIDDDLSFLDLDNEVDEDMVEGQVSTKLDLARAYVDMGDVDGARATLEEVMAEGTEAQRTEAAELLHQVG
jgi:pilus assembly protein FimV